MGTHPIFESDFDCLTVSDFECPALACSGAFQAESRRPCQVQDHSHSRGGIWAMTGSRKKAALQRDRLCPATSTNLSAFSDSKRKTLLGKEEMCFTCTDADFD